MADFIRRNIRPLLPGLESNAFEIIVGILEISGERGELDPNDHADMMDLLLSGGHCSDARIAAELCEKLAGAARLRCTGVSVEEAFGPNRVEVVSKTSELEDAARNSSIFSPTRVGGFVLTALATVLVLGISSVSLRRRLGLTRHTTHNLFAN
eukprot:TRINITY_DN62025_c0_g1_i1.p1 TRINITY_DN62025_c0_g1~~TRINITY_DN62025_c0_g1_i1.p1  ORF type:complete len:153 (-),score=26.30 TRINITY_DN62025_c0_g1_i1:223-681(-)